MSRLSAGGRLAHPTKLLPRRLCRDGVWPPLINLSPTSARWLRTRSWMMSRPARARRRRPPRRESSAGKASVPRHGVEAEELPHAVWPSASGLPVGPLCGIFVSRRPMHQPRAAVHDERRCGAFNSPVDRHRRRRGNELNIGSGAEKSTAGMPAAGPPGAPGRLSAVSALTWPSASASGAAVTGPRPQSAVSNWSPTALGPGCPPPLPVVPAAHSARLPSTPTCRGVE